MSRTASSISLSPARFSRGRLSRRGVLGLLGVGALGLSGCGFRPAYMRTASGGPGIAQRELAAINVGVIADRPGQLLRQALQSRFERETGPMRRQYDLDVGFEIEGENIAIQHDNTTTRIRLTGRADWSLRAQDATRAVIASGNARASDAVNLFKEQYFAADLGAEAARKRIAEMVADQITLQLVAYFHRRANGNA
jgi:LPS-assembly lipoprotein